MDYLPLILHLPDGRQQPVTLPAFFPIYRIISTLPDKLDLPLYGDDGTPLVYTLHLDLNGVALSEEVLLENAGNITPLPPHTHLYLHATPKNLTIKPDAPISAPPPATLSPSSHTTEPNKPQKQMHGLVYMGYTILATYILFFILKNVHQVPIWVKPPYTNDTPAIYASIAFIILLVVLLLPVHYKIKHWSCSATVIQSGLIGLNILFLLGANLFLFPSLNNCETYRQTRQTNIYICTYSILSLSYSQRHPIIIAKDLHLFGLMFRTKNLHGAYLSRADFQGADLTGVDFTNANLIGADFRWSKVTETNFQGANLRYAKFSGIDFGQSNLSGVDLTHAHLQGVDLTNVNLQGAILTDIRIDENTVLP